MIWRDNGIENHIILNTPSEITVFIIIILFWLMAVPKTLNNEIRSSGYAKLNIFYNNVLITDFYIGLV